MKDLVQILLDEQRVQEDLRGTALSAALAGAMLFNPMSADAKTMIDAGHGGKDPGATYQTYKESDITLAVANKIKAHLPDANVTRSDNQTVSLSQRVKSANTNKTDTFVSIHVNSSVQAPKIGGSEVWYYVNSSKGKQFAQQVANAIGAARGIKPSSNLRVLRGTTMPAILIELGFINNDEDRKLMQDPKWQDDVARKIAAVVKEFEQQNAR